MGPQPVYPPLKTPCPLAVRGHAFLTLPPALIVVVVVVVVVVFFFLRQAVRFGYLR
jgi:predicted ABC-type sugar transport system permease subunit